MIRAMLESRRAEQDGPDLNAETIPVVDGVAVIPPREAIRFVRESVPLPSATFDKIVAAARQRSEAFAQKLAQDLPRALQERLLRHLEEGGTIDEFVRDLQGHLSDLGVTPQNPHHLRTMVKTNTASAYTAGRVQMYRAPAVRAAMPYMQYVTVGDAAVRPEHAKMDGKVFRQDDPIWNTWLPPNGYNSFLPGTIAEGRVEAASKAWYSGPIVKLQTRQGLRLSVTINHPVLTPRGYVPAGELREGDDLVTHGPSVEPLIQAAGDHVVAPPSVRGRTVHDQQPPSRIEDVYEAFATEGAGAVLPPAGPLDFHGDGRFMYGEVHVVRPDSLLPHRGEPSALQRPDHRSLMVDAGSAAALAHRERVLVAGRFVRLGAAAELHAPATEPVADGLARGAEALRQLQDGYPARILRDELVNVEIVSWSGHVYDLQSPNGWIVANGIIASNCRCTVVVLDDEDLAAEGLGVSRTAPDGVTPDEGFARSPVPLADARV